MPDSAGGPRPRRKIFDPLSLDTAPNTKTMTYKFQLRIMKNSLSREELYQDIFIIKRLVIFRKTI